MPLVTRLLLHIKEKIEILDKTKFGIYTLNYERAIKMMKKNILEHHHYELHLQVNN